MNRNLDIKILTYKIKKIEYLILIYLLQLLFYIYLDLIYIITNGL